MSLHQQIQIGSRPEFPFATPLAAAAAIEEMPRWYALSTLPRNERSVAGHLASCGVEVFFPTSDSVRTWKNRQRVTVQVPLFVGYIFVRIRVAERARVLGATGAIRLVGNSKGPISISTAEIEFLRSKYCVENFAPYRDLVLGQKVRIARGVMEGIEGVLVRKDSGLRFVVTIQMINQHIAAVIDAADLESVHC